MNRPAHSLVELLCVLSIVGLLLSLLLPAVQASRSAARKLTCMTRLKNIGLANSQYEGTHGEFPPGTTGEETAYDFTGNYLNPSSEYSWTRYQYLSALARLLLQVDPHHTTSLLPPIAFSPTRKLDSVKDQAGGTVYANFSELPRFEEVATHYVAQLRCPSDRLPLPDSMLVMCAVQPVVHGERQEDRLGWRDLAELVDGKPTITNYVGCSGVSSGGDLADPEDASVRGIMSTLRGVRPRHVKNGLAQTIVFGEQLGSVFHGKRSAAQSWLAGGIARARGALTVEQWQMHKTPFSVLGDTRAASWAGFSSAHPGIVQFAFADGHVEALSKLTSWRTFFERCAMRRYSWRTSGL